MRVGCICLCQLAGIGPGRGEQQPAAGSAGPAGSHSSYATEEAERPKTAEELRAELLEQEQGAPDHYLHASGWYWRNIIDQLVLEGDIYNSASLASFKAPVLTVIWMSKTGTEINTVQYRIYEFVRAHHSTYFKLKTNALNDVETVSMSVMEATPVE